MMTTHIKKTECRYITHFLERYGFHLFSVYVMTFSPILRPFGIEIKCLPQSQNLTFDNMMSEICFNILHQRRRKKEYIKQI